MGYSPWGHKESDTTERLSLHLGRDHFPPWSAGMEPNAKQIQGPVGFPEPPPDTHRHCILATVFLFEHLKDKLNI